MWTVSYIGQKESKEGLKTAFLLELTEENYEENAFINEKGEVYLKVDRIVAIPKADFLHFASLSQNKNDLNKAKISGQVYMVLCPKCQKVYDKDNESPNCPHDVVVFRPNKN